MSDGLKPTALDRLIGYLSPESGVKRLRARAMMSLATGGYKGARRDRRQAKGWRPGEGSADADHLTQAEDLRGRSRDLVRNMPIATGAVRTKTSHVVGTGLKPQAALNLDVLGLSEERAAEIEASFEREFAHWARRADLSEELTFDGVQALQFRGWLENGDAFGIRRFEPGRGRYGTRIQLLEADRISNPGRRADAPKLAGGIQVDSAGRPLAAHVSNRHPGDLHYAGATEWTAVPWRDQQGQPIVLHVIERLRQGQTRGIPMLAPVMETLRELEEYTEAELRAAVVSALFTVFIEQGAEEAEHLVDRLPREEGGPGDKQDLKLEPGAIIGLAAGEKASISDPSRPNPAFEPFVVAMLRQIGVALNMPFELLIKHFSSSYSASRGALELAERGFMCDRHWFAASFCQPVWEMVISEAVLRGYVEAPGFFRDPMIRQAYLGAEWIGPSRLSLDPFKDARADEIDVERNWKTNAQVCAERTGGDWSRKIRQRGKEVAAAQEHGAVPKEKAATAPKTEKDEDDDA